MIHTCNITCIFMIYFTAAVAPMKKGPLSRTTEPIAAYSLLKDFLIIWKQLEHFKEEWGNRKLDVQEINTPSLYKKFW